ncbi:MAG TPA: hypothetical protein VLR71_21975 [Casimicrobiaceae bacterium]|nr:hypothetical protein [Casimicrobiaceae bacterium]
MNARLVVAACAAALYCAGPPGLRLLYPLLTNPTACAQRAEVLAQAVIRVQALTSVFRRT